MTPTPLTGLEKAAVLLKSLPAPVVETILRKMDPRRGEVIRAALRKLDERRDLSEIQSRVLDETFTALADAATKKPLQVYRPEAPAPPSPKAVTAPSGRVDIRIDAPPATAAATARPPLPAGNAVAQLAAFPAEVVATALQAENARTITALMNQLDMEAAGNIYKRLPSDKRKEVSLLLTAAASIPDAVLERIAQAVANKCQTLCDSARVGVPDQSERDKRMAALLRGLDRAERMDTVAMLESTDADLAGRVKMLLYQFDDILRMENVSVRKLLTEMETRTLATALADAVPAILDRIYANLSKRAQESLREEIELAGKVPKAKAAEAQQQIVDAIQRLDQRGELVMIEG